MVTIRHSTIDDRDPINRIHQNAFGLEEGREIVDLVTALATDETARPALSLIALHDDQPVGHILFTKVSIPDRNIDARILAPLAVLPEHQGRGVGGALIREGLAQLTRAGVGLVFVLGHLTYYPRFGFTPAAVHGLTAPFPLPPEHQDGWMVQALPPHRLGDAQGEVRCADALMQPEYW